MKHELKVFTVLVTWRAKEGLYTATSDDIPGLFVEASSFDEVREIVEDVAPELIRANLREEASGPHDVPLSLVSSIYSEVRVA